LKFKNGVDLTNGVVSGVEGYFEIAGTSNFGATSLAACVQAVLEITTATTITAGGHLAGVAAQFKSDITPTGLCAAFITKTHPNNTGKWPYGLYMGDGSVKAPILIGASTSAPIIITSTGTSNMVEVNSKLNAASGILRGVLSYAEFSGTNVGVATNVYAIRGYAKISGTTAGANTFYTAAVQGKLELSGTIAGGKHCALLGQFNSSAGAAAGSGTMYAVWADAMQLAAKPGLYSTMFGAEMPDGTLSIDSVLYAYGKATYLLDLQGPVSDYLATIGQSPGAATGSIKINTPSGVRYLLITDDPTA
jgi:hypothetical protein